MDHKQITICMFSNLYPPVVSGSSTHSASLSRELAKRGHKVVIITSKLTEESKDYEEVEGVSIYRLPAICLPQTPISLNFPWLNLTFSPGNVHRIENIIDHHDPDIFHLHNHMFDLGLSAVLMRRRTGKPLVITIHTVIKHSQNIYNLFLYPADRLFLKYCVIKQADTLICPDWNIEEYVHQTFDVSNTTLIPYGVNLPEMPDEEAVGILKSKYSLDGKRVILSLGHVHEIRNREDLFKALPEVIESFPNTILLIVGANVTDSAMILVRKLRLEESVIFTGALPYSDVPTMLALADIEAHWLTQEAAERTSLGIASLEAMGAGKVILAAANENTYGAGVLRNGWNFILVKPGDPDLLAKTIIDLLNNPKKCQTIGDRARQTIYEHFSWDRVCSRTLEVYRETIWRCT